ncbi:colicin E3/pyocin S6 family cytotoxin [Sphingomonas sp. R86521]|uniref:colicin E3/pyocin S6 family cytotoxin n=1 Tax=Sphingomonas sp. R86521 TaxID=3093860 RepID=UPI0036D273CA
MIPRPRPSFLDECEKLGYVYGADRWRSWCGAYLYTWDSLHGEIEVFTSRGRHFGVAHAMTGVLVKPAVKGRRINV